MSAHVNKWRDAILPINSTIQNAILNLDLVAIKIVLVVNQEGLLEGTLSDGDIRRSLLKGFDLSSSIANIIQRNPLVVPPEVGRDMVKQLMLANKIQQIPIVNANRQVVGLHLWDEIVSPLARSNLMIIMAGGKGMRLRPHTEGCPKPMLTISGKPMLEHIIERAKSNGFSRFVLAVHYLGHMVKDYFGTGDGLQVEIDYIDEEIPLGTAGALGLLPKIPLEPFIVTNGDVLTDINYGELLDFHLSQGAAATMAIREFEWQHPYGVVQTEGIDIAGFEEKPISRTHINAGIYALNPAALTALDGKTSCDMPTLFERLQLRNERTIAYPMHEPWLDVGRLDDLTVARDQFR